MKMSLGVFELIVSWFIDGLAITRLLSDVSFS